MKERVLKQVVRVCKSQVHGARVSRSDERVILIVESSDFLLKNWPRHSVGL